MRPPADAGLHIVDPSASDSVATMMLVIPQMNGRDLDDFNIALRGGAPLRVMSQRPN